MGQRAALRYIPKCCCLVPPALAHGSEAAGSCWLYYLFEYEHIQISSFICHLIIKASSLEIGAFLHLLCTVPSTAPPGCSASLTEQPGSHHLVKPLTSICSSQLWLFPPSLNQARGTMVSCHCALPIKSSFYSPC